MRVENSIHLNYLLTASDIPDVVSPCGLCRQVIREFCALDMPVLLVPSQDSCGEDEDILKGIKIMTLDELLPMSFGPEHLPRN